MQTTLIQPPALEQVTLDTAVTAEPRRVHLPKKPITPAPTGGGDLLKAMQSTASAMDVQLPQPKRVLKPKRQTIASGPSLTTILVKATARGVRRVIERAPQVFD